MEDANASVNISAAPAPQRQDSRTVVMLLLEKLKRRDAKIKAMAAENELVRREVEVLQQQLATRDLLMDKILQRLEASEGRAKLHQTVA